jgi:hypothetical protein
VIPKLFHCGSAFFHNFARMTWSLRKQVRASDDVVTVMLVPHKQNDGSRLRRVGLEFAFDPDQIRVRAVDPVAIEGLLQTQGAVRTHQIGFTTLPLWNIGRHEDPKTFVFDTSRHVH